MTFPIVPAFFNLKKVHSLRRLGHSTTSTGRSGVGLPNIMQRGIVLIEYSTGGASRHAHCCVGFEFPTYDNRL